MGRFDNEDSRYEYENAFESDSDCFDAIEVDSGSAELFEGMGEQSDVSEGENVVFEQSEECFTDQIYEELYESQDEVIESKHIAEMHSEVLDDTEFQAYQNTLCDRYENGDDSIKQAYNDCLDSLDVSDADWIGNGTGEYAADLKEVHLNSYYDSNNPCEIGSTYYHEVGHALDDYLGDDDSFLSEDMLFQEYLAQDISDHISHAKDATGLSGDELGEYLSQELQGNEKSSVSDIYEAYTSGKIHGDWGHGTEYWLKDKRRPSAEAFAHMVEASFSNTGRDSTMEQYFPHAYTRFKTIVRQKNDRTN